MDRKYYISSSAYYLYYLSIHGV